MGWSIHHPTGLIYNSPRETYLGYTIFTTTGGNHTTLVDMQGRVVHQWHLDDGMTNPQLQPNGNLMVQTAPPKDEEIVLGIGGSMAGIVELDWDSNVVWRYDNNWLHHDFERLANGNTLALKWEQMSEEFSTTVKGGNLTDDTPKQMLGDVVIEIAPDGSIVKEWKVYEKLDVEEDVVCFLENRREWTHGNSIKVDSAGNYLLSFRQTSTVGVGDPNGGFIWKWGPGIVSHQHNMTELANGNLLLFDNGSHRMEDRPYSRIVEVNRLTNEIEWEYKGRPVLSFFSSFISSADRLANGNTFICEGATGRFFEVTNKGEIVWEYINPFFFLSARTGDQENATFRAHRYGLDHPAFKGKDLDPDRHGNINRVNG